MPEGELWLDGSPRGSVDASWRAVNMWQHIQDRPSTISARRGVTILPAQTVRIEQTPGGEVSGVAATAALRNVTVIGIVDHPTQTDTDLQRGDHFVYLGVEYRVTDVVVYPGCLQASAEAIV